MGKKNRLVNNKECIEKMQAELRKEWRNLRIYIGLGFLTLGILLGLTISARAEIFNIRIQ